TQHHAGWVGYNIPRFELLGDFGNLDVRAAAVVERESQRLGLTNDNDLIYYTFSAGYNLRPHRFQLDVTYFRDRFNGADTQAGGVSGAGSRGVKTETALVMATGRSGVWHVRLRVRGNLYV